MMSGMAVPKMNCGDFTVKRFRARRQFLVFHEAFS
jgi:hypothetical protein